MNELILLLVIVVAALPGLAYLVSPSFRKELQAADKSLRAAFGQWLNAGGQRAEAPRTSEAGAPEALLRARVAEMEERERRMAERIENLEAIVTSVAWDALPDAAPDASADRFPGAEPPEVDAEDEVRRLARRVR